MAETTNMITSKNKIINHVCCRVDSQTNPISFLFSFFFLHYFHRVWHCQKLTNKSKTIKPSNRVNNSIGIAAHNPILNYSFSLPLLLIFIFYFFNIHYQHHVVHEIIDHMPDDMMNPSPILHHRNRNCPFNLN